MLLARKGSLSVQLSGLFMDSDSSSGPSAGDTVAYTLRVENNGTATVWGMTASADLGSGFACVPALESLQLAPGDWTDCISTYEVSLCVYALSTPSNGTC